MGEQELLQVLVESCSREESVSEVCGMCYVQECALVQTEAYAVGEVVCTGKTLPSSKDSAPLH